MFRGELWINEGSKCLVGCSKVDCWVMFSIDENLWLGQRDSPNLISLLVIGFNYVNSVSKEGLDKLRNYICWVAKILFIKFSCVGLE